MNNGTFVYNNKQGRGFSFRKHYPKQTVGFYRKPVITIADNGDAMAAATVLCCPYITLGCWEVHASSSFSIISKAAPEALYIMIEKEKHT